VSAHPIIQVDDLDVYYGTSQILFGVALSPHNRWRFVGRLAR